MERTARFGSLLKLLDDQNKDVQQGVQRALLEFEGDASHDLAALGINLEPDESKILSESLHAGRQKLLEEQWVVPASNLSYPDGDYESFEALLRLISDFLHDGITLRPSLSDELDIIAQDAHPEVGTARELADWLFKSERFSGNHSVPFDP